MKQVELRRLECLFKWSPLYDINISEKEHRTAHNSVHITPLHNRSDKSK